MTNPTPHGQVPEALIDLIDAYAETRHRCGGIYNAKTEAARKAVIEALSGVQALSAAPTGFVPIAAFDRLHAHAESLAARLLAAEQAAPKAAPVVWLSSKQLRGVTALHGQYLPFRCQPEGRFDTPVYLVEAAPKAAPASNESAYQRGYMDGMAKGRRDAEAAPQQEAPVADEFQPCPSCFGTGVDGDADDYGRTIDVSCGDCNGSGRAQVEAATEPDTAPSRYREACTQGGRCLGGCFITEPCYLTVREMARAARAQADSVTAPAGGANWQDISTAPKDGTRFVAVGNNYGLYSETQHVCIAQWFRGCWMEASDWNETSELKYLTHWMPLPPLPDDVAAPAEQQAAPKAAPAWERLTRDQIREVFMAHGFTIKEGQTDLKQYVYDAAYALLGTKPAPLSDDAKDAARYRWLREGNDAKHGAAWHVAVNLYGCEWDAAIDAALAAQGGK